MMKSGFVFLYVILLCFLAASCKEAPRRPQPGGVNVVIHDQPCSKVKADLVGHLKKKEIPFSWQDTEESWMRIGPVTDQALEGDGFTRTEEKARVEIKCIDPISTRISLQMEVRGQLPDRRWAEVNDPDKLAAYGKRFLDRIYPRK